MKLRVIQPSPHGDGFSLPPGWRPGRNEVWAWHITLPLDRPLAELWHRQLSSTERVRLEQFRRDDDRERFLAGRGLLRSILGVCVGLPPADVPLQLGPFGKPALDGSLERRTRLRFNISHSGRVVLLALTCAGEIGVDVEAVILPDDWRTVVSRFFSLRERTELAALPASQCAPAFFSGWTRKEACLKATGKGLAANPVAVEVTLAPRRMARLLSLDERPVDPRQWLLCDLQMPDGYAGALAVWAGQSALER